LVVLGKPESRCPARRTAWHKTLGWLPVALLLAGVLNHLWQVQRHQLSPWLGAGFGMFATTDLDSARQVHLVVQLADGSEREVILAAPYQDLLKRARALPSDPWLDRLAEAAFEALRTKPEIEFPTPPLELRIEVWRPSYQAETLQLTASLLITRTYPFPLDGG
jgi:hypothetical protein